MAYRIAVVGATGMVGREILRLLAESRLAISEAMALEAGRGVGGEVSFGEGAVLPVRSLEKFDFAGCDLAIFAASAAISAAHARRAAAACAVIDTTEQFRLSPRVPLRVPEAARQPLEGRLPYGIIASPAAATIQLALTLKPLSACAPLKRVVAMICHAASDCDTAKAAMDELWTQTRGVFVNDPPTVHYFPRPLAFNLLPQVGAFTADGVTEGERAVAAELCKLLDPDLKVVVTAVRVPVMVGNAAAVAIEFARPFELRSVRAVLAAAPRIALLDRHSDGGYATPLDVAGEERVFLSRLRRDLTVRHGLMLWSVADNLRLSARNAVAIAEALAEEGLVGGSALEGRRG